MSRCENFLFVCFLFSSVRDSFIVVFLCFIHNNLSCRSPANHTKPKTNEKDKDAAKLAGG